MPVMPSVSQANDSVMRSVLVVDDENGVRDLMSRWLQAGGYSVASASGAVEALALMESLPPAVALCDIRMPGRDGFWLADRIRQKHPDTAVIMATGLRDARVAVATLGDGVVDCLTKPFNREQLREAVSRGLEWHRSARDSRCWHERLDAEVESRHARLADAIGILHLDSDGTLDAMLSILTIGDRDAYAHARRVAAIAVKVARALGLPHHEVAVIRRAALLHDLGKLAMPDALLRKPAPLTAEELAIVRRYPALGASLIANLPYLEEAADIVRDLHERPDGQGYPVGLRAAEISIGARIVAVADAYDTMTNPRVFRDPLGTLDALLEMERCSGTQFDPAVFGVLRRVVDVH